MIRVADYIAKTVADYSIDHVFMLTGGGAMHLNDAFGAEERLQVICNHHEQACAMAAEGYARITGQPGVINVTTGPGGINALNGVFGAWTDSIPMLIISGQVKRETYLRSYEMPLLRQLGDQEVDIITMVKSITKYAVTIFDPTKIRFHLEKALYEATHGRPGPCWLDIPVDVQSTLIDESNLEGFIPPVEISKNEIEQLKKQCVEVLLRLQTAKRPVILAGSGIRIANSVDLFTKLIHKLGIPVTTAWTHDIIDSTDPVFCGRPGTIGDRAGNFVVQNSDCLLILGSRLNIRQVSYNWNSFARYAYKMWVDVDPNELAKPTVKPDLPICADLSVFLELLDKIISESEFNSAKHKDWLTWCQERRGKYFGVNLSEKITNQKINPYYFCNDLFKKLNNSDVVVCGNASATIIPFQTGQIKMGQRLISNSGSASMGYDLPASVGAAVALRGQRVICLAGDGSLHLNIQELQTIFHHHFPIKIIVLNNNGYLSIRTTQDNFFHRFIGEGPNSGMTLPDYVNLAQAYGIPAVRMCADNYDQVIQLILNSEGPLLVDVMLDPNQVFEPKTSSKKLEDGTMVSAPLEDMFPFLPREEFRSNLLIPQWDE